MPVQPKMMVFGKSKMVFSAPANKTDTPTQGIFVQNLGVGVLELHGQQVEAVDYPEPDQRPGAGQPGYRGQYGQGWRPGSTPARSL